MEKLLNKMDSYLDSQSISKLFYQPQKLTLQKFHDFTNAFPYIYKVFRLTYESNFNRHRLTEAFDEIFPLPCVKIMETEKTVRSKIVSLVEESIDKSIFDISYFTTFFDIKRFAPIKDRLRIVTGDGVSLDTIHFITIQEQNEAFEAIKKFAKISIQVLFSDDPYASIVNESIDCIFAIVNMDYISKNIQLHLLSEGGIRQLTRSDKKLFADALLKTFPFKGRFQFNHHLDLLKRNQVNAIEDFHHLYSDAFKEEIQEPLIDYFTREYEGIITKHTTVREKVEEINYLKSQMVCLFEKMYTNNN